MGHPGYRGSIIKIEEYVVVAHKLNYQRYDGLDFNSCNYTKDTEYSWTEITQVIT